MTAKASQAPQTPAKAAPASQLPSKATPASKPPARATPAPQPSTRAAPAPQPPGSSCIQRILQSAAVTFQLCSFLVLSPGALWLLVFCLWTPYYWVSLLYGTWWLWDRSTSCRGGRAWSIAERCRDWQYWHYLSSYFPVSLVKTADLDPTANHIFCVHPHGLLCFGAITSFGSEAAGFSSLFPGIRPRLTTLEGTLLLPGFREFVMSVGTISSSRSSLDTVLRNKQGGEAPVVMVGGVPEMSNPDSASVTLYLRNRKGFCKMALRHGASLVPCFVFGETSLYQQGGTVARQYEKMASVMKTFLGIAPVLFLGRGLLQESFGLLPQRRPLCVVVGAAIPVERMEAPTQGQIDSLHMEYMAALTELYREHNTEPAVKLVITC